MLTLQVYKSRTGMKHLSGLAGWTIIQGDQVVGKGKQVFIEDFLARETEE